MCACHCCASVAGIGGVQIESEWVSVIAAGASCQLRTLQLNAPHRTSQGALVYDVFCLRWTGVRTDKTVGAQHAQHQRQQGARGHRAAGKNITDYLIHRFNAAYAVLAL